MKVRFSENIINLRAENEAEKHILDEMWVHGIIAFGGGSELGICSKKFFGSRSLKWLEDHAEDATKGVNLIVEKMAKEGKLPI